MPDARVYATLTTALHNQAAAIMTQVAVVQYSSMFRHQGATAPDGIVASADAGDKDALLGNHARAATQLGVLPARLSENSTR